MRPIALVMLVALSGCPEGDRTSGASPGAAHVAGPGPARVWSGSALFIYDKLALDPPEAKVAFELPVGPALAAMMEEARCPCGRSPLTRQETGHPAAQPLNGHLHDMKTHYLALRCPDGHAFTARYHTDCWCRRAVFLCPACRERVMSADPGACRECDQATPSDMISLCLEHTASTGRCGGCEAELPLTCAACAGKPATPDVGRCRGCGGETASGTYRTCRACTLRRAECTACGARLAPPR